MTLTLTLDRVIRHTVVHHSSTSTYIPNFIEIGKTFFGRTDVRTDGHLKPILLGRLFGVDLKITAHGVQMADDLVQNCYLLVNAKIRHER